MKRSGWLLVAPVLVSLVSISCSGPSDQPAERAPDRPAAGAATSAETADGAGGAAVDLSKVDVCEWLPAELVATTVGATVSKPARRSDYGTTQGCEYELDPAGADTYEYGVVWLNPASAFGDPQEALATAEGLGQEATTEPLSGLGDRAYVIHNATEEQSSVHVLLAGRLSLEVTAEHAEDARKIAELALSRIDLVASAS